jgi:hypothetical protein
LLPDIRYRAKLRAHLKEPLDQRIPRIQTADLNERHALARTYESVQIDSIESTRARFTRIGESGV